MLAKSSWPMRTTDVQSQLPCRTSELAVKQILGCADRVFERFAMNLDGFRFYWASLGDFRQTHWVSDSWRGSCRSPKTVPHGTCRLAFTCTQLRSLGERRGKPCSGACCSDLVRPRHCKFRTQVCLGLLPESMFV